MIGPGVFLALTFLCSSGACAQADYQARFLFHKQVERPGFGLAGWAVASDVANPVGQRGLLVAGVGYKWRSGWLEVMPGTFVIEHQRRDPVIDFRSSLNLAKFLNLSVEGLQAFRTKRSLLITTLTVPVPDTAGRLQAGGESDLIFKKGRDSLGIGPRVALKLTNHLSWALGYQLRRGPEPNFWRSYALATF